MSSGRLHWERGINTVRLRLRSWDLRCGIGARLGIAFAAVASLAVVANLLIEHEILIMRTTRVFRIAAPTAAAAANGVSRMPISSLPQRGEASPKSLVSAIEHYAAAIRNRVAVHDGNGDRDLTSTVQELDAESQAYLLPSSVEGSRQHQEKLRQHLRVYRLDGAALVRAADSRQQLLKDFWECFEALDARTKASLSESWKIFGRVIARKSLVDLNSSLDGIRRGFASLPTSGLYDRGALDAVTSTERTLAATLRTNDVGLTRTQGATWVRQVHADLENLNVLQDSLIRVDTQRRAAESNFWKESLNLMALANDTGPPSIERDGGAAPTATQDKLGAADSRVTAAISKHVPNNARSSGDSTIASRSTQTDAPEESTTETAMTTAGQPAHKALMFWLSVAVLVLLLWISVRTVISIVGPVRGMRAATRRVAAGEDAVQVTRGGIRELDELAVSFNQMAEQIADGRAMARDYQERLEATVTLRTHELKHLAEHDPLTQLPNRRQLFQHLQAVITRAQVEKSCVCVFFVDLDNFKNINDSLGHAFGDRVLGAIADRLSAKVGPGGFTARLGGDEFTIVRDGVLDVQSVDQIGWDLVRAFQQPVTVDGRDLMISISVGASVYPEHGIDAEALLRAADAALFRAKALGRSQLSVFSPALLNEAVAKFSTEQGLRYALERGEFELVFQPEVDATTLSTHLVEALLRWRLPDGRLAAPGQFLAIAEESGLIMEISDWVLRTAIETAARWHHGEWPEARVAINLSSRQLLDARFVDHAMALLRKHRLPAHCIEIELTENVLQTGASTIDVLRQLRDQGVAIALDDFGIGYSSLASIEQLPLSRVKLDSALIARVDTSARSAAIVRALVGLCHNIGLEVTAEGVEREEQLALLAGLSPIYLQGYLLARPVSAQELLPVIAALPDRIAALLLTSPSPRVAAQSAPAPEHPLVRMRANPG
jgi:diguanylate cyclase (GGDEF)-like protein